MIFNSLSFLIFLPTVFVVYWFLLRDKLRLQNLFLLLVSYVFYGWWDWRFLSLIFASSLVDFVAGRQISTSQNEGFRKIWLSLSLVFNLGLLGFFKYFNFFVSELETLFLDAGIHTDTFTLQIILAVGISFYTFQTMSYTLDVYHKKLKASDNFVEFAAYVSFFPQLVAGPIERAKALLPQFERARGFDVQQAISGLRLIIWGLFKKVVIADSLAPQVNEIFNNYQDESGATLVLGAIFFAFQIYGDFSGYSDIAIGCAKLLGFELMSNFKFPYFSRDIAEFWRRWHISLSSWFRDYLYIPLGGSRGSKLKTVRNVFIIFLVSGFWHGANWTFIAWGGLHALFFLPLLLRNKNRQYTDSIIGESGFHWRDWLNVLITFTLVCIGWVFFRAESVSHAVSYLTSITPTMASNYWSFLLYPACLLVMEWFLRKDERLESRGLKAYEIFLLALLFVVVVLFNTAKVDFIYFQF